VHVKSRTRVSAFWRRAQQVARQVATVVLLALLVSGPLESMIPDAHDRDVAGAQTLGDPTSHDTVPSQGDGRTDSHPIHLDHCSHSHLAGIPKSNALASESFGVAARVVTEPASLHESVVLPPHQRPPIA
jgi:hypothetical protein